jgi:deoxyribodipyrimidine photo-lyase
VVRHGDVVEEALRLAHEWDLDAICMSADVTPYARLRERRLASACGEARIELRAFDGVTVVSAGELTPAGGDHYRVFTPYWRAWSQSVESRRDALAPRTRAVSRSPRKIDLPKGLRPTPLPTLASLTAESPSPSLQPGGETAARKQLERWLRADAAGYDSLHDDLAGGGTSRLSAHLHFGCLSAATPLRRRNAHPAAESFARQLCWRDFHHQVLAARGDYVRRYLPELADVPGAAVHRPWLLERSRRRALRYPPPLLDLADASVRRRVRRGAASAADASPRTYGSSSPA